MPLFFSVRTRGEAVQKTRGEEGQKVETINYGIRIGIQIYVQYMYVCKECTYTQLDRVYYYGQGGVVWGARCQIQLTTVFINMQWRVRNTYTHVCKTSC